MRHKSLLARHDDQSTGGGKAKAKPAPEPEVVDETTGEPAPAVKMDPPTFSKLFPTIGEWFDRVQKWAQFNGRPIPELGEAFKQAYEAEQLPHEAAEALCLQKTDYATANGPIDRKKVDEPPATA